MLNENMIMTGSNVV